MSRPRLLIACLWLLTAATGCRSWGDWRMPWTEPSPVVFPTPPTADDIVRAINSNTAPIRQLSSDSVTLTAAGFPPLRADLAYERQRRLRLRANLLGPEVDLGSNEEYFWVWFKHNPQPGIFYARHDQYERSPVRQAVPLDPAWLIESLGLVQLDPLAAYQGPRSIGAHRLELVAKVPTPAGEQTRIYVIHDQYGWVLEQRLLDANGRVLASSIGSQHRYYPDVGVSLPQHVELQLPPAELSLSVHVRDYRINAIDGNPEQLWTLPQLDGYPLVDITDPSNLPATPRPASITPPPAEYAPAETSARPWYRRLR